MPKRGNRHKVPKGTYRAALMDARRACRKGAPNRMLGGELAHVYLCLQVERAIRDSSNTKPRAAVKRGEAR